MSLTVFCVIQFILKTFRPPARFGSDGLGTLGSSRGNQAAALCSISCISHTLSPTSPLSMYFIFIPRRETRRRAEAK